MDKIIAEPNVQLRENWRVGRVECRINDVAVFSSGEYRTTAEWCKRRFGFSDSKMMQLYADYKEDYDAA